MERWKDVIGYDRIRPVRRSDGVEYTSMTVAAEAMDCWVSNIWGACNGKQKTAGGFGWEYI